MFQASSNGSVTSLRTLWTTCRTWPTPTSTRTWARLFTTSIWPPTTSSTTCPKVGCPTVEKISASVQVPLVPVASLTDAWLKSYEVLSTRLRLGKWGIYAPHIWRQMIFPDCHLRDRHFPEPTIIHAIVKVSRLVRLQGIFNRGITFVTSDGENLGYIFLAHKCLKAA